MITPQIQCKKLADEFGLDNPLYLKREDLHPIGSHKGRSIPLMINKYYADGIRDFVISSSGNAALAAARAIRERSDIILTIFVGDKINPEKLKLIKDEKGENIIIRQVPNPKQEAILAEKNSNKIKNLRQSTDDTALEGYATLAQELAEIKNLSAIFIPTSSGTTAEGMYREFQKLDINPQIHIIQTPDCHPFVEDGATNTEPSLASAIVDKVGHRKENILKIIDATKGAGWVATNEEITKAINETKQIENIDISPNSALSVAGLKKAIQDGWKFNGAIVCLITGL
jgi:threonine synthase